MKLDRPISTIMSTRVHTIRVDDTLEHASAMFRKHHVRHLPVVHNGSLLGMLSLTDIQRLSFASAYGSEDSFEGTADVGIMEMLGIKEVMNHHVVSIPASGTIREVGQMLTENEFHALPVMEGEKLIGIVTTTDLIQFMMREAQ
jgi:CBS domain-containing protein